MTFLGLNIKSASRANRSKRLQAFIFDAVIVLIIIYIVYKVTGAPDFPAVKQAMEAAKAGSPGSDAQELANKMFDLFNSAYFVCLLIWFVYEAVTQLVFKGATIGKRIVGLRIMPINPGRNFILHSLLLIVRSAIKCLFLYLFQGFPFLVACLTIFANTECRSGFDIFVRTYVKNVKELQINENYNQCAAQER